MSLAELLRAARRRWWVVLATLVLATAASSLFAAQREQLYESRSTIAVTPRPAEKTLVPEDALTALLNTYGATAKSQNTKRRAAQIMGVSSLPGEVDTSTEAGSGILYIFVRSTNPEEARRATEAVQRAFTESVADNQLLQTDVISPPVTPTTAVQPRPPLIIGIGVLLGFGLGMLLAGYADRQLRRIESVEDLAGETSLPLLARLPVERGLGTRTIVWTSMEYAGMQEQLRTLRTNIEFLLDTPTPIVQLTSAMSEEGKSTIAANLALAFAQTGRQTVLVDGDLRRPTQHSILGLANHRGLTNLLARRGDPVTPVDTRYPMLSAVTAGPTIPNSTEMLHLGYTSVIERMRALGQTTVIDSPPLITSDPLVMAGGADAVVLVVRAGARKPGEVRTALEKLQFANAPVIGVVLNYSGEVTTSGYGYRDEDQIIPAGDPDAVDTPSRRGRDRRRVLEGRKR